MLFFFLLPLPDSHTKVEDEIFFPALEAFSPGCVQSSDSDGVSHKSLSAQLQILSARIIALSHMPPPSPVASPSVVFERLLPDLLAFKDASLRHMLGEEKQITPVLAAEAGQYPPRVQALMERMARAVSPAELWLLLPLIITSLDMPSAEQYVIFFDSYYDLPTGEYLIN